ncbi:hypothetical protein H6F89_03435 [Cyanobacteria bacterium FACHB-63]|nr:hypothetical protein [Cyanobacteria bacterium FACHB-63]
MIEEAVTVGIPLTISFTGLTCYFYHPVRGWLADEDIVRSVLSKRYGSDSPG